MQRHSLDDLEPEGPALPPTPASALRALNDVQRRLEGLRYVRADEPDGGSARGSARGSAGWSAAGAAGRSAEAAADAATDTAAREPDTLRATARALLHALDLSPDVALACVLRNQVAGSYPMRHSVETAVVAALVGRQLRMRPARLLSLVAAALALHATGRHAQDGDTGQIARALRCTQASEADWFACLLLDHVPQPQPPDTDVTVAAHVLRMADRYCAGISPRNYRRALLPDDALARVLDTSPDPELTAAFVAEIGPYPPGTMVRLASGESGIVAHRDGGRPEVLCLHDADGRAMTVPLPRRVGEGGCAIAAALSEEDCDVRVSMKQVWGPLASL